MKRKAESIIISRMASCRKDRMDVFREIPVNNQGFVLLGMSRRLRKDIMSRLSDKELVEIVEYLDPDEATDLLRDVGAGRRAKVLREIGEEIREKVEFLIRFDPRTAAGIMSLDYVEVDNSASFREVAETIQKHERRTGKVPTILVVEDGFLAGELHAHMLAIARRSERVGRYAKKIDTIRFDEKEDDVIRTFKHHRHKKIAVLDENKAILGVIYSDDVLRIIEKRSAETLGDFAGVSKEEDVLDSALTKVKNRYKWLIINLATAFLAASVVSIFQETISAFVLLAVYMPIVAGMGGNAGTQTLAVVVRGLALKETDLKTGKKVILNEILAGGTNGIINGILVAAVAFLWNKSPMLGLVIGMAMVINLIIAGFFGAIIPLIMKRLGKDPASSATIFITTATDVFGFFVFLGLAAILL